MPEQESRQIVTVKATNDILPTFEVFEEHHVPSWQRYGDGGATFKATAHRTAQWVSLSMDESGEKSTRSTMMALTPESGRALYEFLGTIFGGAK